MYNIRDYGATGDGKTNEAAAIQAAIDACSSRGGGTVLVPAGGTYVSGQFSLKSHVNLRLESGATLVASNSPADYVGNTLIYARSARDISITGRGTIEGQGIRFMRGERPHIFQVDRERAFRPLLIQLVSCRNVTLQDLIIHDAPACAVNPVGCDDLFISGLRVLNNLKIPGSDGIALDRCRNIRIRDCHIEAGDDCIALKCTEEHEGLGPCENVTITGCTLTSTSSALKIGTETWDGVRNVVIEACIISASNRGLSIMLRDRGDVENVLCSNMIVETRLFHDDWWGKSEPIHISVLPRLARAGLGRVRNVCFNNILCRGESGVFVSGVPGSQVEELMLDNVRIELDKWTKWPGGLHDRRPCPDDQTHADDQPHAHPTAGLYLEQASEVSLRDVQVSWGENRPEYYRHALEGHHVEGLHLDGFRGKAANPELHEAVLLDEVKVR